MRKLLYVAITTILISPSLFGQTIVRTPNGSNLYGQLNLDKIKINTKYGVLNIDAKDIYHIDIGVHIKDDMKLNIEKNIKNLGSVVSKQRTDSEKFLLDNYRFSYHVLKNTKSSDREISKRITAILENINAEKDTSVIPLINDDIILLIDGSEYKGQILLDDLAFLSDDIGLLNLNIVNIKSIQFKRILTLIVNIEEAPIEPQDKWIKTNIFIRNKMSADIKASGSVDCFPQEPGRYITGPSGLSSTHENGFPVGALVGKIGINGHPFVIGTNYNLTSDRGMGELYLRVVSPPRNWNALPMGGFMVKIQ